MLLPMTYTRLKDHIAGTNGTLLCLFRLGHMGVARCDRSESEEIFAGLRRSLRKTLIFREVLKLLRGTSRLPISLISLEKLQFLLSKPFEHQILDQKSQICPGKIGEDAHLGITHEA
jgi:hypothetical protein